MQFSSKVQVRFQYCSSFSRVLYFAHWSELLYTRHSLLFLSHTLLPLPSSLIPPPSSLPELETAHIKRTSGSSAVSVVRILHACWYNICNNKGEVAVGFLQHAKEDQICELRVSNFLSIKKCIFACINIY